MPLTMPRYDGLAAWYDSWNEPHAARNAAEVVELLGPGEGLCLDLGCGTGQYFATLAATGRTVVGLDRSADRYRGEHRHQQGSRRRGAARGQAALQGTLLRRQDRRPRVPGGQLPHQQTGRHGQRQGGHPHHFSDGPSGSTPTPKGASAYSIPAVTAPNPIPTGRPQRVSRMRSEVKMNNPAT